MMDGLTTCYKTIAFVGDSRVKNLYPPQEWLGDPPQLIYNCRNEAKIDFIIKMVEEKLNEISETNLLVVVLGLHADLMDLIPSSKQKQTDYAKGALEGIIGKISSASDKWKKLHGNAKFLWCIPCIPDFKRLGNKSSNKQYIPYDKQDILFTYQVKRYLQLVKEFKQVWENSISSDFVMVDLNIVFNDRSFYQDLEDSRKFPNFYVNQTVDGLHLSPSMSPIFWRYILSISEPVISDVEMVEQLKGETESKKASSQRKSPRLSKKYDSDSVIAKAEVLEPIIDIFPLAEEDIDSESWIKEELGMEMEDKVEETLATSVLESELNKVFNPNLAEIGNSRELCKIISGLSYIIGIKPDSASTANKCKYDCVLCSSHIDSDTFSVQELKAHIESKKHVMNVMMVENTTLYEQYNSDNNQTSTQTLLNEILEYEAHLGPQNIIPATENTYIQERERVILKLMDDLTALEESKCNNQKEEETTLVHIPLHINSVVRRFKRITTKNQKNNILSVVKKLVDEDGNISSDIIGVEKRDIGPIKLIITAKGPGIVPKVLTIENKSKIDSKNIDIVKEKGKIESHSSAEIEYPKLPIRNYNLGELEFVHQHFCIPVLAIKNRQKNRIQDNIVIVTDDRENFDIHLANFNEKVNVFKVPELSFSNAFEIIKTHPNFGKGTLFIFSCGTHDILQKELLPDCVQANCLTPQKIFALPTTIDLSFLIKKAMGVHLQILESTQNDNALFCGIYQVFVNSYNSYTIRNRPCLDHVVTYKRIAKNITQNYIKVIGAYDQFAVYHAQTLGYNSWNLPVSFCRSEKESLRTIPVYLVGSSGYSYCPAMHKRNGDMAKHLCLKLLKKMSSKHAIDSLAEISSNDESDGNVPYEQVAIITDSLYLPYLNRIASVDEVKVKFITVEKMRTSKLKSYFPKDVEYVSKRTLYLIVTGIHDIIGTSPSKNCLALGCHPWLPSLNNFKRCNIQMTKLRENLRSNIEGIEASLPEGSDFAVLPPMPVTLLNNTPHYHHHILHLKYAEFQLCKVADDNIKVAKLYSQYVNAIFDIAYLSLLKINQRLERNLDVIRDSRACMEVRIGKKLTKADNVFWQNNVRIIVRKVLKIQEIENSNDFLTCKRQGNENNANWHINPIVFSSLPDFTKPPPFQQALQPSISHIHPHIEHTHAISSFDSCSADFSYERQNVINRDLDEIIQFAKVIQNLGKNSRLPSGLSHLFTKAYIVGAKAVINPLLDCNIKTTIINHNFCDFEENDFRQLLNKIGSPQQKSVCCLVFNISTVLATRLEMSSGCLSYSCKPPLYLSTLQRESLNIPGVMDEISLFTSIQLQRISKFIRRLSQLLPVVILPLTPIRIYCEDLDPHKHHISHSINNLGYPVVFGSQALWQKTIQSLVISWNNLMEVTNRNYDSCNYISSYIASNPKTFLVLNNIETFIANWLEPDVWKGFAEAFLMSLVPKKVSINIKDLGHQSNMDQVTVTQISPSIPPNFFEELFYTADSNVIIIKEKDKYVLKGMTVGRASILVKKLNHYHIGDTILVASGVYGNDDDVYEFSLMQSLLILAGFEKVYRKYKPEIIQNLRQKINEVPDAASLKAALCVKGPTCRGPNLCYHFHSPIDKRRNPFLYTYMDALCSKSQMADGLCQDGNRCDFSHNVYELKFHPFKYQVKFCPSGESAEICHKHDFFCNYAHKDSPEMFYISGWEDLILFGPHHALDYFTGAIRAASKIKDRQQSNFKVILLSPSIEFLDIAVKASDVLLKKFGLNVCSFDKSVVASSQILIGHPSSFSNLSAELFHGMRGAIIVEDIQNIFKNEKLRENMCQTFQMIRHSPNVVLNAVFVSATYEYGLAETISEIMGLQLKQLSNYDHGTESSQSFATIQTPLSENLSLRLGKQQPQNESTVVRHPTTSYSHQKRARSRSPLPLSAKRKQQYTANSSPDRSSSQSPLFSKSHTELSKRFGEKLFEEYSLALGKMRQDFEGEFSVYITMPELYPDYENFYSSFVEMYNLQHKGKSSEHRERLWKLFWKAKVEEIKKQDWEVKQNNLVKEFDKRVLTNASSCHSASNPDHGSYSFERTIDLIDGLCGDLGFLGPSVKAMLKSSRDMGTSSKEAFKMFTDSENIMLISMVLDKIKSLCQSTSGEKLLLYKQVADWIPKFLEDAKNGPPTPASKDVIDVDAIGRASVGKGSKFALDLIKTAIAYEGISNPSKEFINELFIKVCNVHYALSMDE